MIDDYGGNRYGKRYRTKFVKENVRSYRCGHCSKLCYFTHREVARGRLRCVNCGGPVEETEPSVRRNLGVTKKQLSKEVALGIGDAKPLTCRHCFKTFRSTAGLSLHIRDNHPDQSHDF